MNTPNQTIAQEFKANQILWMAMLAGQVLIATIFIFLLSGEEGSLSFSKFGNSIFMIVAMALTVSCVFLSFYMNNKRKVEIPTLTNFEEKIAHFRSAFIMRAALLEGPALFSLIFMFMEKNLMFLLIALIPMCLFVTIRPTIDSFTNDYQLTSNERNQLNGVS